MLGMLGGGQLGRFFVISAQKMGYQVTVLDPDKNSPAGKIANLHLCANYNDIGALKKIIQSCLAITTEFENIPATTLKFLEKDLIVRPSSDPVSIVQNRIFEKSFLKDNNFPVGPFVIISNIKAIDLVTDEMYPAILKIAQFGYDGKGQAYINNQKELISAFENFGNKPCVLEKKLVLDLEISVVLARGHDGSKINFPVVENQHVSGILDISIVPARVNKDLCNEAIRYAELVASKLNYIGVIAVEFFVSKGRIYVNEVAPRPHNSGHYTIDACDFNQFDLQVLTLTGNAIKSPVLKSNAVMVNLLGDRWFKNNQLNQPNFDLFKNVPNETLHIYGKNEARSGRKMGHFTLTGDNLNILLARAEEIKTLL